METPPSEEKEVNHRRELGGELVPVGKPVVFEPPVTASSSTEVALAKPEVVNPFWSDHVKEDAVLASLRPSFLPTDAPGDGVSGVVAVSPQRPMSLTSDVVTPEMRLQYAQMVERTLIAENQRLKEEGERLRSLVNFYDEQRHGDSRASSW